MVVYTLSEAAKATGLNRSTLFRAIRSGRISAARDEQGQWALDPAEVHRVYAPVASGDAYGAMALQQDAQTDAQVAALRAQLAEMRERLSDRDERLSETRVDRDAWREQAQRLALPSSLPAPKPERPMTWRRWLALTTLLAIVVTAAIVAATVLAISFALAERPADTVDRLAEPTLTGFYEAGAPGRSAHLARTDGGEAREIRMAPQSSSSRMFIAW
jgi:excisionase family DNA binding protein